MADGRFLLNEIEFIQVDSDAMQCLPDCSGQGTFSIELHKCICVQVQLFLSFFLSFFLQTCVHFN